MPEWDTRFHHEDKKSNAEIKTFRFLHAPTWPVIIPHRETKEERLQGTRPARVTGDAERLLLLGLACSHPNPGERPRARAIVQILARSAPPPDVPASKPAFMWPALPVVLGDDDGEMAVSGTSTALTSSSSYYASSAGWTTQNYLLTREHDVTDRDMSTA